MYTQIYFGAKITIWQNCHLAWLYHNFSEIREYEIAPKAYETYGIWYGLL